MRLDEERIEDLIQHNTITNNLLLISSLLAPLFASLIAAMGLLSNPSVLLLDEPTSGLDSPNALRVVSSLNQLSNHGLSIICSIHQPRSSIFHKFELLLILHKGTTVYFGPASAATSYFEVHLRRHLPPNTNPADFYLDVLETDTTQGERKFNHSTLYESAQTLASVDDMIDSVEDAFSSSVMSFSSTQRGKEMLDEIKRIRDTPADPDKKSMIPASRFQRTWYLIMRTFTAKRRSGREFIIAPVAISMLAVLAGSLFGTIQVYNQYDNPEWSGFSDRMTIILFSIIMFSLQSIPQLGKQVHERAAFQRERAAGLYSAMEYFLAISVTDTPLHLVITVLFSVLIYSLVNLLGSIYFYMLSMYVVLLFGYSAEHLIILLSSDAISALSACMGLIGYSFLLNGQVINREDMSDDFMWLFNTSFIYNAYEMMTISEMEAPELVEAWGPVDGPNSPILAYDFAAQDKWICFRTLICAIFVLRIGIFLTLHYKYVETR